jgi:putative transposase
VEKTQAPVRYDPFNAGIAYAFIKGHWVQCLSEHYAIFAGRSEREIQLATAELRKRNQLHGQQFTLTARKLADFLSSLEAEELLLEQRLRDTEAREILTLKEPLVSTRDNRCIDEKIVSQEFHAAGEILDTYEDF